VRIINSTYNEVDRNLRILEREGLVNQRRIGHKRIVRLNLKNKNTLVILEILKLLKGSVDLKQLCKSLRHLKEDEENRNWAKH
jgi:hypothetical protein